jgi:hypothetical protein
MNELPECAMDSIHRRVKKEFTVGDDVSDVLKSLKLEENEEKQLYSASNLHIDEFCKWLWCIYEQMHYNNESPTMDRK